VTSGGFSSKRLTRVREVLERYVDSGFVPGAVAVVARHGEVHIEAMGNLAFEGAMADWCATVGRWARERHCQGRDDDAGDLAKGLEPLAGTA
jgi:hypothetical protein